MTHTWTIMQYLSAQHVGGMTVSLELPHVNCETDNASAKASHTV